MRTTTFGIVLLLTMMATNNPVRATMTTTAAKARTDRCFAVRVNAVTSDSSARVRYRRRFSADDVLDLRVSVWLPVKNNAGLVEIKLYTPSGHLYEVLRARADPGTSGYKKYRGRRARVVASSLPVAGTHITGRSLYGKWRAEVTLDGQPASCTRKPKRFIIES